LGVCWTFQRVETVWKDRMIKITSAYYGLHSTAVFSWVMV
jgi:hypothetical protein